MAKLEVGNKAPAFTLLNQDGQPVKSANFKGAKLVIYFYPKADTPGCTTQSCEVQAALPDFGKLGVAVIGISPDEPARQKKFAVKYNLTFPLLSDIDHKTANVFGVWGEKSMYGRKYMGIVRSAFLVDEKGKIAAAWYGISPKNTVPEAMNALAK